MTTRRLWTLMSALVVACVGTTLAYGDQPETFLKVGNGSLRVTAGEPVALTLNLPTGESWSDANIGQMRVRRVGIQENLNIAADPATADVIEYTFPEPGYGLVILGAGPAAEKGKSDSWQRTPYCAKFVVQVEGADEDGQPGAGVTSRGVFRDPGLMGKVGQKVEILPLMLPPTLRPNADLAVRVYWEGAAEEGVEITAYGPGDAEPITTTTRQHGIANFIIGEAGRWLIRYQKTVDGTVYTGDLVFEVAPPQFIERGNDDAQ